MASYAWLIVAVALAVVASEDVGKKPIAVHDIYKNALQIAKAETKESANDVVDRVLQTVNYQIMELGKDPIEIPDTTTKLGLVGKIWYTDGWLQGLSTLKRYKKAKITPSGEDLIVDTALQYEYLLFTYKYESKIMLAKYRGYLDGRIRRSRVTVQLRITPKNIVTLQKFKFNKLGALSLKFTGNSLTDWIVNLFTTFTKPILKLTLKKRLSEYLLETFEELIELHNSGISGSF